MPRNRRFHEISRLAEMTLRRSSSSDPAAGRPRSPVDRSATGHLVSRRSLIGAGGFVAASAAFAETLQYHFLPSQESQQLTTTVAALPPMSSTIISAAIEPNGWVMRVTLRGTPSNVAIAPDSPAIWASNFAAYVLAPNGHAPALTLTMSSNGFTQGAGMAISLAAVPRTLIGTKVLRRPIIAGASGKSRLAKTPDEVEHGDGTITVRIALSQHVYAGDTGLLLNALAGWRTGAPATSGVVVSNGSTVAAPAPIVRWSDVPYQLQGETFALEVVVASHHPNALAPVAAVKFTVTDGISVKTYWATALSTSPNYARGGTGKPLRVYGAIVDPTTATALTKGLLRCDFEVYPWIGPVQTSDPTGQRSMTNLGTAALSTSAFVPFVVAYNPGGAWIVPRYAYVDPTRGATVASSNRVSTSSVAAAMTPLASINLAIESLRLWAAANPSNGGTLAAANGQPAIAQSIDGCRIRLVAGATYGVGSTSVGAGAQTAATWCIVEGDPADPDPATNCILRTPATANATSRVTRVSFRNLAIEAGSKAVFAVAASWLNSIELRGAAGQTAAATPPVGVGGSIVFATDTRWWRYGLGPALSGTSQTFVLLRNVSGERSLNAPVVLNCARLPTALPATYGVTCGPPTDAGACLERMVVGCDLRYLNGRQAIVMARLDNAAAPSRLTLGKTYPIASRQAWINNLAEIYGEASPLFYGVGENGCIVSTENIIEGNTFAGDRTNNWYNDLNLDTVALNDSENCKVQVNRFANNVLLKNASKHDAYNDGAVQSQRIGVPNSATRNTVYFIGSEMVIAGSPANIYRCIEAGTTAATGGPVGSGANIRDGSVRWQWVATESRQHGYRPQAVGAWSSHYGFMNEGNIDLMGPTDPSFVVEFQFEFYGIGSQRLSEDGISLTSSPFVLDKSGTKNRLSFQRMPDGTGGGNYQPLPSGAGVYILGRARTANIDTDQAGVLRTILFAAGALEPAR